MAARNRRRLWLVAALVLVPLLLALVDRFEPFAKRVDGKTVAQWLEVFGETKQVDPVVVDAFQRSANAVLVGTIQSGLRESLVRVLLREAVGLKTELSPAKTNRMMAAGGWLSWLYVKGYPIDLPRDPRLSLWLDQYDDVFYAPRFVQLAITTPEQAATAVEIPMPERKTGQRVVVGAKIEPSRFSHEQKAQLFVKLQIAPGHHIDSLKKSLNSSVPTTVEIKLPDGAKLDAEWEAPKPEKIGEALVYRKEVVLRNRLVIGEKVAPGKHKAEMRIRFQVCNEAVCWPPESLVTEVEFEVPKSLAEK